MSMDKAGYVSVGAEVEDEVMPDRVVFSICFGGGFDTKDACLDNYNADRAKVAAALVPFGLDAELTCRGYTCYARSTRRRATVLGYSYHAYGTIAAQIDAIDVAAVWTALNTCGSRAWISIWQTGAPPRTPSLPAPSSAPAAMRRHLRWPRALSWATSSTSPTTAAWARGIAFAMPAHALMLALLLWGPAILRRRCWNRSLLRSSAPWMLSGGWSRATS